MQFGCQTASLHLNMMAAPRLKMAVQDLQGLMEAALSSMAEILLRLVKVMLSSG